MIPPIDRSEIDFGAVVTFRLKSISSQLLDVPSQRSHASIVVHANMSNRRIPPSLLARATLRTQIRVPRTCLRTAPALTVTRTLHQTAIRRDQQSTDGAQPELTPKEQPEAEAGQLQSTDLLDVYNSLVARGLIVWDAEQVRCVMEVSPSTWDSAG